MSVAARRSVAPLVVAAVLMATGVAAARAEGPVTRAEAEAWLRAIESAHAREDLAAVEGLTGSEPMRRLARLRTGRLFEKRNYLELRHRIVDLAPRPDGTLEVGLIEVLRSRRVGERHDAREKNRRRYRLGRVDGRVVLIDVLEAPQPQLPAVSPWLVEEWTGTVSLHPRPLRPFGSPEGVARVRLTARLRVSGVAAQGEFVFGLHPFVRGLEVGVEGAAVREVVRDEGTADRWTVRLGRPVAEGQAVDVTFDYELEEIGEGTHARIGPERAHLFPESAWHPLFPGPAVPGTGRAMHDLTIEVPSPLTAVAPGRLVGREDLPSGRRRLRWRAEVPGEALAIVAGEMHRDEVRLGPALTAALWRPATEPAEPPAAMVERLRSMASFLEEVLGPPATSRITVVQASSPGLRALPGFFVLFDPEVERAELFERNPDRQPLFFLAHGLAHLWLQDSVRPVGGPAQVLAEGLCDHLAFAWMDRAVDSRVSLWHRDRILTMARATPKGDRALVGARPGERGGDVFGQGKALVVLDGYRAFAGEARWRDVLRRFVQSQAGHQVGAGEILEALADGDARLESYVAAWVVGEGFADVAVSEPTVREVIDESTGRRTYEVGLTIENLGLGPVPVSLRTLEDRHGASWEERTLELGSNEQTVLRFESSAPLRMVEADERLVTWQSSIKNDTFPVRRPKRKSFPGEERVLTEEDRDRLESLLRED